MHEEEMFNEPRTCCCRVLVVDDHPIVRRGLAHMIGQEPDLEICGEADDTVEALTQVRETKPDVMVVDLSLKTGNGIQLIEQVKACDGRVRIVVSSMHDEGLFAAKALRAGALGYISKQEPARKLLEAIRQVARGEIYLSLNMSKCLLQAVKHGQQLDQDPITTLSAREREVFQMIGQGMPTRLIARKLFISPKTVETHREKMKEKLQITNTAELSRRAIQWNLENC